MERRGKFSKVVIIFFAIFLIWFLLQLFAPLALPPGSVTDLTGITVVEDNKVLMDEMPFPWNSIYGCGDRICHEIAERSFFINGNQMPFCARCTAIWLGLAIGVGFMIFFKVELNEKFIFVIIIGTIPIAIDGLGQLFGLWVSTNLIRVITGLLIGILCGAAIGIIVDEVKTIRSFKKSKSL